MIDPNLKARNRIYEELPRERKDLMAKYILPEEEHERILEDIKRTSYEGKKTEEKPVFIIVLGQTGSGKSNLTAMIRSENKNLVIIDSDKYKSYRNDNVEIMKNHLSEYAFLTAPDSYWHRDQMICDAIKRRYNILMECATSKKEGMFVDLDKIKENGYSIEIDIMGVSELNSLLSIHERYEAQIKLNYPAAKLTNIDRHDDSFVSLKESIKEIQNDNNINIRLYERSNIYPCFPNKIYSSKDEVKKFSCALEALLYIQGKDEKNTFQNFNERYMAIQQQMFNRNAPETQIRQLEEIRKRYQEKTKGKELNDT